MNFQLPFLVLFKYDAGAFEGLLDVRGYSCRLLDILGQLAEVVEAVHQKARVSHQVDGCGQLVKTLGLCLLFAANTTRPRRLDLKQIKPKSTNNVISLVKKCCTENTNKLIFIMYEVKLLNFDFHQNYVIFHT